MKKLLVLLFLVNINLKSSDRESSSEDEYVIDMTNYQNRDHNGTNTQLNSIKTVHLSPESKNFIRAQFKNHESFVAQASDKNLKMNLGLACCSAVVFIFTLLCKS